MRYFLFICGLLSLIAAPAHAGSTPTRDPEFDEILSHDIADLTVTSVAKRSQRLSDTAAAAYVITQEQIRRAGVYTIPDALRLAPGVHVAKLDRDRWAVSSRGFNNALNNKLLVLIDGRAIYTPVFSGVYWGDQSTSINDIERIEVIRGPGASLYGANAVNGVINIITKSAENTQGNMISATTTAKGNGLYEARHGGKISHNDYYRVFGQYLDAPSWNRGRGGLRIDGETNDGDDFTVTAAAYSGSQDSLLSRFTFTPPFSERIRTDEYAYGGHILGRMTHRISTTSEWTLQGYFDHYSRLEYGADQHVSTADLQFQNNMQLDERNYLIWGAGARLYYQNLIGSAYAAFNDRFDTHEIFNAFVQDEYTLIPETLYLTTGSKFEYNDFSGFEIQPTVRMTWHPDNLQTVWAAVSRAVRTPSSIEEDISLLARVRPGPIEDRVTGNIHQQTEKLIAYELGHRIQAAYNISFDTALFYNDYEDLQTIGLPGSSFTGASGNTVFPYLFTNLGSGKVFGGELAATWNVNSSWRLSGSYSYLKMDLEVAPGAAATLNSTEKLAPRHQFSLQSFYNINDWLHWDNMIYYVDNLSPPINAYVRYDTRIAWMVQPGLEVSFIGRNLVDDHSEFPTTPQMEVGRSYIGQVLWKF